MKYDQPGAFASVVLDKVRTTAEIRDHDMPALSKFYTALVTARTELEFHNKMREIQTGSFVHEMMRKLPKSEVQGGVQSGGVSEVCRAQAA